ncbi:MAG: hypothetical protein WKF59_04930 [Chitinophagaceae bacterium]
MTRNNGLIIDKFTETIYLKIMQELVERIQKDHGLSAEQSHGILNTIKEFIKEKFPMMGGAVDNIFPSQSVPGTTPLETLVQLQAQLKKAEAF